MTNIEKIRRTIATNAVLGHWVPLTWIREDAGLIRSDFDAALIELARTGAVVLIPEENQKVRTTADDEAALVVGGEAKHLVCLA